MLPNTPEVRPGFRAATAATARTLRIVPSVAALALLLAGSLPLSAQSASTKRPRAVAASGAQLIAPEVELRSLKRSDLLSQEDIARSAGRYRLSVPEVGDVYVKALRSPRSDKTCHVHKPSLIRALAADPPVLSEPKWMRLTIYDCPWGTCCLGPLGGGCYIIVSK